MHAKENMCVHPIIAEWWHGAGVFTWRMRSTWPRPRLGKLSLFLFIFSYLHPSKRSSKGTLWAANPHSKSNIKDVVLFIESTDISHQCWADTDKGTMTVVPKKWMIPELCHSFVLWWNWAQRDGRLIPSQGGWCKGCSERESGSQCPLSKRLYHLFSPGCWWLLSCSLFGHGAGARLSFVAYNLRS